MVYDGDNVYTVNIINIFSFVNIPPAYDRNTLTVVYTSASFTGS